MAGFFSSILFGSGWHRSGERAAVPHTVKQGNLPSMPKTWFETAPQLIDVAMGRSPADTVIRKGRWVNVHSGEVIPDTDIAIIAERFAYVGPDASHAVGPTTKIIEANGRYLVPGLCDGHMHRSEERRVGKECR